MAAKEIKISRGRILYNVVKSHPMNLKDIIERAGYKYSSFYVHVNRDDLPFDILTKYGRAMHYDFTQEFPEMNKYTWSEEKVYYKRSMSQAELQKELLQLKSKYEELAEQHRNLLEKYTRLLENMVEERENGGK